MTVHQKCGAEWTGASAQHCPACCQTFTGTAAGDAHRVGDPNKGTSRCLSPAEMIEKKLLQDWRGIWTFGSGTRRDNLADYRARNAEGN